MIAFGLIIALLGFALRYFMNRRAFNRRNGAGVEMFNSYESATVSRLLEGIGRLVGFLLILAGLGLVLVTYLGKH